jgi:hypothetical protein
MGNERKLILRLQGLVSNVILECIQFAASRRSFVNFPDARL